MYVRNALLEAPLTVHPDEPFESLLHRLLEFRQATAAVLDDEGSLVGIVGIHDILRKIVPLYVDLDQKLMEVMHEGYFEERLGRLQGLSARDFMTSPVDTVSPDDTLIKTVGLIVENRRKTLPVLDDGRFVGMITRRSILETVTSSLRGEDSGADGESPQPAEADGTV